VHPARDEKDTPTSRYSIVSLAFSNVARHIGTDNCLRIMNRHVESGPLSRPQGVILGLPLWLCHCVHCGCWKGSILSFIVTNRRVFVGGLGQIVTVISSRSGCGASDQSPFSFHARSGIKFVILILVTHSFPLKMNPFSANRLACETADELANHINFGLTPPFYSDITLH
jgi:hypothetical protein